MILGAQAVTLRRVKSDQYNGRPIVVLPPLEVNVESLLFSEEEEAIYTAFEAKMQARLKADLPYKHAVLDADPSCADLRGVHSIPTMTDCMLHAAAPLMARHDALPHAKACRSLKKVMLDAGGFQEVCQGGLRLALRIHPGETTSQQQ